MPVYCYECETCRAVFEVRHGMFFENQRCIKCYSEDVFRVPSEIILANKTDSDSSNQKPGKIVDDYIKEASEEIKKEKKRRQSEEL